MPAPREPSESPTSSSSTTRALPGAPRALQLRWTGAQGKGASRVRSEIKVALRTSCCTVERYLDRLGASVEDLFHHVVATVHDPAYRAANTGALRMEVAAHPAPGLGTRRERKCSGGAGPLGSAGP